MAEESTWLLKRWRHPAALTAAEILQTRSVLAAACINTSGDFIYLGRSASVRPVVALLLRTLLRHGGGPVSVRDMCEATYGRPASLRAVRQSAFRASRAMERADCPLIV